MIETIEDLENALSNWPPETPVQIVYETYATGNIELVRQLNGVVQIVAENK